MKVKLFDDELEFAEAIGGRIMSYSEWPEHLSAVVIDTAEEMEFELERGGDMRVIQIGDRKLILRADNIDGHGALTCGEIIEG